MTTKKKQLILGQNPDILMALIANVISWFVNRYLPSYLPLLLPKISQERKSVDESTVTNNNDTSTTIPSPDTNKDTECIVIGRPGGIEQLRRITLKPGIATCGYNLANTQDIPFTNDLSVDDRTSSCNNTPPDCVIVRVHAFSVNYADCCIRWGLYESANEFVGYPIIPGFDISGIIERIGTDVETITKKFQVGDAVFGCTLFGAYSTRVLVPAQQLRKIPTIATINRPLLTMTQAASIPAAALTSLYSLFLSGHYHPLVPAATDRKIDGDGGGTNHCHLFTNNSILIHSAAGGVGSMLVQMSKILHLKPIVGVVGHSSKVDAAKALGCDIVIDKSQYNDSPLSLWDAIRDANCNNNGLYSAIMDSNGIDTLQHSYDSLAPTGRLIVFGFHTNLPMGASALNVFQWIKMGIKMSKMPSFNPMDMTSSNKSILAFNLSFFSSERDMLMKLFEQIVIWFETSKLVCPRIAEMSMNEISQAHDLIQSGKTVGKIVITTPFYQDK